MLGPPLTDAQPADATLAETKNCTAQVFTPTAPSPAGGTYKATLGGAKPGAVVVVGYSSTGPPGIKLIHSKTAVHEE